MIDGTEDNFLNTSPSLSGAGAVLGDLRESPISHPYIILMKLLQIVSPSPLSGPQADGRQYFSRRRLPPAVSPKSNWGPQLGPHRARAACPAGHVARVRHMGPGRCRVKLVACEGILGEKGTAPSEKAKMLEKKRRRLVFKLGKLR